MAGVFTLTEGQRIILASTSPRRRELLGNLGVPFSTFSPAIQEPRPEPAQSPADYALKCAILKNNSWSSPEAGVVLSCDTIVVIDGKILGKPADMHEALTMLTTLNGRWHTVYSCFCLRLSTGALHTGKCEARVKFHHWPEAVLRAYAAKGESLDKAGAYAIQGSGTFLVEAIEGSWTTVVGLPMCEVTGALLDYGVLVPLAHPNNN